MKNPTPIQVAEAIALKDSGLTFAQVKKATGLNYSQIWLPWFRAHNEDRIMDPTSADFKNQLARARGFERVPGGAGFRRNWSLPETSWGELSALCGIPESRIRRTFEEYTNVDSEGLRMGRGGRWLNDDATFYRGDRPDDLSKVKAGTDFVKGKAGKEEAPTMGAPKAEPKAKRAKRAPSASKADKISKLRAKAASTTFPHERDAFNAKADAMEASA